MKIDAENRKFDIEKLLSYGFEKIDGKYVFNTDISGGDLVLSLTVGDDGVDYKVTDKADGEEYILAYVKSSVGSFVGGVRADCERIIEDAFAKCCESSAFELDITKQTIDYMKEKYGTEAEYLWDNLDACAFRKRNSRKWYAVVMSVEKHKLGIKGEGVAEIINLKQTPDMIEKLVDSVSRLAGYHMNKKHWYTLLLDGSVPFDEVCSAVDESYKLVK